MGCLSTSAFNLSNSPEDENHDGSDNHNQVIDGKLHERIDHECLLREKVNKSLKCPFGR